MIKQQTAVEWLLSFIEPSLTSEQKHFFSLVIEQAKQMEKEGIKKAYNNGYRDSEEDCGVSLKIDIANFANAEDYYIVNYQP